MVCNLSEIVIASRSILAMYCAFNSIVSIDNKRKPMRMPAKNISHVGSGIAVNRGTYRKNQGGSQLHGSMV